MITTHLLLHSTFFSIPFLISSISALNLDGTTLISFKHSLLPPQSPLLQNWNQSDLTPCSWTGVTCAPQTGSVIALSLPNSHLSGPIPNHLPPLQHLRLLDLSNNSINGTLPLSIFNCSDLQSLSLSSNCISGHLPEAITTLQSLRELNLSNNKFSGSLPESLGSLKNLTTVSLKSNCFSGGVPGGFDSVKLLDLSSNSFTGTLTLEFDGRSLNYLNLSNNKISGSVFPEFAKQIPANAVVDLSFNNFTGEIPHMLSNLKTDYFAGNLDLCGKPLSKICTVPSSHSIPPNVSLDGSDGASAAIAAIPKTAGESENHGGRKVNSWKITAIVVGDIAAVLTLAVIFFYAYQFWKRKPKELVAANVDRSKRTNRSPKEFVAANFDKSKKLNRSQNGFVAANFDQSKKPNRSPKELVAANYDESGACFCFGCGTEEETSETATLAESVDDNEYNNDQCLIMVDGETELEIETLLKASAYILGSSGGSIVYKAVVGSGGGGGGGGVAFAVRRLAECGVERMKDFEKIIRVLSKFRHRNLVKVRGFYWGEEEKLVIYDYVSNGSLAAAAAYGTPLSFTPFWRTLAWFLLLLLTYMH
ncbi:hypothetical protein L1987_84917 [Smallanthus sonchifolius]|uniref:Uncharacterized protein n=1 Tax=Smallanthus sonchifolius TaxID=185202 RepID=A0ACB8XVQ7_9ASTR|nr:hypothetical protein L1987_84917 [Smallanthus sonchifolius]